MKVSFHTLGCKLNYAETGGLAKAFTAHGFDVVDFGQHADVTVINTCTVTEEADRKCRQVIRRALRTNPDAFIAVTGCYAQLKPEAIATIPGVDAVLGAQEKFRLFNLITSFAKQEQTQVHVSCIEDATTFGPAYAAGDRTRAFLKVQDGCDYQCSFCTIPLARGRSRSQRIDQAIAQAEEIAAQGVREVVLSGVNIGLFGQDTGESLLDLLRALDGVSGVERYRISSIEPNLLTDAIIDFVAGSRAFQPHFHLPLQSGDNTVLGKMRRRYRRELYAARVRKVKSVMPHACIGVDVIVGFPAEDADRFANTVTFVDDLPVSYLHVFTYSERPNTVAVDHLPKVGGAPIPPQERSRRNRVLRLLSEKKRQAFYEAHRGDIRPVLWEDAPRDGLMFGFSDNYIKVQRPYDPARVGLVEPIRLGPLTDRGAVQAEDPDLILLA